MEFVHAFGDGFGGDAEFLGEFALGGAVVGEEFVQRGVEEADGGGAAGKGAEDGLEVVALVGEEFFEGVLALFEGGGEDHFAHGVDAVAFEEHVFGAAEADAGGSEGDGVGHLVGLVGVGADVEFAVFVGPAHELGVVLVGGGVFGVEGLFDEDLDDFGGGGFEFACEDFARGAVDGEEVAFFEDAAADGEGLVGVINLECAGAADADFAHLAGDEGGVAGDAAAGGEDAFGCEHAADVFRGGLDTHEQDVVAFGGEGFGFFGVEDDFACGCARAGGQAGGDDGGRFAGFGVEDRGQQLAQGFGRDALDGFFFSDEFLLHHLDGNADGREAGAFAVAGLEHEEFAVFDGELKVLHVAEVALECLAHVFQFAEGFGHFGLECGYGVGGAHAGHDVFALGVDEVFAVEDFFAGGGVAGEGDAGAGFIAGVAEDHGLHVDGGAPFVGDAVFAAVDDGAFVVPGAEDGADCAHELLFGVGGEGFAGAFVDEFFEAGDEFFEGVGVQFGVLHVMPAGEEFSLEAFDHGLEGFVVFARAFLHAHHDIAIHLDEAAVAVVGEAFVLRDGGQAHDGFVVEAEVEDGVHHAGHGVAGAGAHGHEEGVFGAAKGFAESFFESADGFEDLWFESFGVGLFVFVIVGADLCSDRKSWRHGQTDARHLGEVRALAAEQGLHRAVAVGFAVAEVVNILAGFMGRLFRRIFGF